MGSIPADRARNLLSRCEELLVSIKLGKLATADYVLRLAEKSGYLKDICTATVADREKWLLAVEHDPDYHLLVKLGTERKVAIIEAIRLSREDFVSKMIDYGLDVNVKLNRKTLTLLGACVQFGQGNILRKLVELKANVNILNPLWQSPIFTALEVRNLDALQYLLEHEANPNLMDSFGQTPLIFFLRSTQLCNSDIQYVEVLLRHGADPNLKDIQSKTAPLHEVLWNLHAPSDVKAHIVEMLLERRAEPDVLDTTNATPLHHVCTAGIKSVKSVHNMTAKERCRVVALLLKYGANPNLQDDHYNTPLHEAAKADFAKVAEILVENGADPELRNMEGFRPSVLAKQGMGVENILAEAVQKSKESRENQAKSQPAAAEEHSPRMIKRKAPTTGVSFSHASVHLDSSLTQLRTCLNRLGDSISQVAEPDAIINAHRDDGEYEFVESDEVDGAAVNLPPRPGPDVKQIRKDFFNLKTTLFGLTNEVEILKRQLATHKDCRAYLDFPDSDEVTEEDQVDARPMRDSIPWQPNPRPSDDTLLVQACHVTSTIVGHDWKSLFRELEADDLLETEVIIKELEARYVGQLREQAYQALLHWKNRKGSMATLSALCEAIDACGLGAVRQRIEEKCQLTGIRTSLT